MDTTTDLFTPLQTTEFKFPNRIVMAALTRMRCEYNGKHTPNDMHVTYYSERARKCAFVLTECTAVSLQGQAYPASPGIWSEEQVEGWKKVTDEVH